ncbi:cyclic peptide export ABC transporter [Massilia rubra]|uniref:Cyclic peptide export ABC transporter n=1 Tax=Massilia rubra TaxID=2607910 RepID=A0ABX0M0J3_9BURK|nr:cyclic peptide export ABC transporter [Massilia rubra]NHZ35811.1 cyclic peptide export ABC transporter [Massilia rubra]
MNLFDALGKKAPNKVFFSMLLGSLAGFCYAFLIPLVISSLSSETEGLAAAESTTRTILFVEVSHAGFAAIFLSMCLFILFARTLSRVILARVAMDISSQLRIELCERILSASVAALEQLGPARLHALLTEDVRRIVMGGQALPALLTNLVTLVGMLGFLLYLNVAAFKLVLCAIACGIITYQVPIYFARRMYMRSRQLFDTTQEAVRGIIFGMKELKLNARRREQYLEQVLHAHESALLQTDKRIATIYIGAASYGDLICFFVIGIVAFVFVNYHAVSNADLLAIFMTLLYVAGPVAAIIVALPEIAVAKASLRNVQNVFKHIAPENTAPAPVQLHWDVITCSALEYAHPASEHVDRFSIGPIDLSIAKGQITFIVGGNGSGKSTLGKILTLHYAPTKGTLQFGTAPVGDATRESLRQHIAAVFTDYYLFDRVFDFPGADEDQLRAYLRALDMDNKVKITNGKFSTLALSDGQRKRLALLVALLEDRDLYVFDEWAADQDPVFKEVFYRKILPDLRGRNKAIVVISHDDRYFDIADRLVIMESGQVREIRDKPRVPAFAIAE